MRQAHNASGSRETRRRTGGEEGVWDFRSERYRWDMRFRGRYILSLVTPSPAWIGLSCVCFRLVVGGSLVWLVFVWVVYMDG